MKNETLKKLRALVLQRKRKSRKKVVVISELRHKYSLRILLEVLELSRSTYYYAISKIDNDTKNDAIMNVIIDIFYNNKSLYNYRRITMELHNQLIEINHKKVKRSMKRMRLYGITPKAKYKTYKGNMNGVVKTTV